MTRTPIDLPMPRLAGALCAGDDPDLWFSDDPDDQAQAKRVCAMCPVQVACLKFALDNEIADGTWGGLTEAERWTGRKGRQHGLSPHGTEARHKKHRRDGEEPCAACKAGRAAARYAQRQRAS